MFLFLCLPLESVDMQSHCAAVMSSSSGNQWQCVVGKPVCPLWVWVIIPRYFLFSSPDNTNKPQDCGRKGDGGHHKAIVHGHERGPNSVPHFLCQEWGTTVATTVEFQEQRAWGSGAKLYTRLSYSPWELGTWGSYICPCELRACRRLNQTGEPSPSLLSLHS